MNERWWTMEARQAAQTLESDPAAGLTAEAAAERLRTHGENRLKEVAGRGPLSIFLEQFQDFIVWVLIGAAVVSGFLGEWIDTLAIVAIVILNSLLGFIQEYRAERSLAALRRLAAPVARVIRGGRRLALPASELVPGDVVELEAGDHVPADCRVLWLTSNFTVQEASLTGESVPVAKTASSLGEPEVPLADRANMVYLGTSVASGKARALVAETGMQTELGRIAGMIQAIESQDTPLQRKLEEFGKWIVWVCFALVTLVFILGVWRGMQAGHGLTRELVVAMFLTSVSLAVAAIPEGLPAVVTIALALGVRRMVRRHALIRKLPSVETLGCATVICSDKTGTLTKNEMTVRAVWTGGADGTLFAVTGSGWEPRGEFLLGDAAVNPAGRPDLLGVLDGAVQCNGAELAAGGGRPTGDPTEIALLSAAAKAGLRKEEPAASASFVEEIPFDSERKKMTIIRERDGVLTAFVKGAPDILLDDCAFVGADGLRRPLTPADREAILRVNDELAGRALRVLAVARRDFERRPEHFATDEVERGLTFLGLMAMIDPPREEVREAIALCRQAGIRTVMITGDHKKTAVAVARELGFFGDDSLALTGEELDRLGEEEFAGEVERISVYARVSPEHKLRIVRAWKKRGQVVAMTGDGVNDAPAVKEADIGVAMGITGTDVTKEVSDMVITDDNFASIVAAVEEGRGIYDNIKKFVHYLLSCNSGEILVMFVATLAGLPAPLLPIHILWVNLVTDGLPALALGVDPVVPDIMRRPPRRPDEPVVPRREAVTMVVQGTFIAACSLGAFAYVLFFEKEGIERARTAAFIVLSVSQLFHAFNCRSETESLFHLGVFSNPALVWANLVSFGMQMAVVYIPFLQKVFRTEPLGVFDWVMVIGVSSLPLWAMELVKLARRRIVAPHPSSQGA